MSALGNGNALYSAPTPLPAAPRAVDLPLKGGGNKTGAR
jgi:hypothetical protein